jgi:iron(III) transport system permease protein
VGLRGPLRVLVRGGWRLALLGAIVAPIVVVASSLLTPDRELWSLLARTTLLRTLVTTLLLALGVAIGAGLLGSALAWLIVTSDFPGRNLFRRLLVTPLALPSYVVAFVYVGLLQYAGPVQTTWRGWFGEDAWFPPIRTPVGAGIVLILTLYPYVYLPALVAFGERSAAQSSAAATLGLSPWQIWWRVAAPSARPALAAGMGLVVMETVTDVGVARVFSVSTVGDSMLKVWFGLDRRNGASEMALLLVGIIVLLAVLERTTRGRQSYATRDSSAGVPTTRRHGWRAVTAVVSCSVVLVLAAGIPLATLVTWALRANQRGGEGALDARYASLLRTTVELAGYAAIGCTLIALVLVFAASTRGRRSWMTRTASLGYAIPGLIVAAGALSVLAWADGRLDALANWNDRLYVPFLLAGSTAGVIYALMVRFLSVARENIEAGAERINHRVLDAATTLGASRWRQFRRIQLPLAGSSIVVGALLVAVDAMKELPATLLLRPAGKDTLAVFVWNMTNESRWEEAATPALTIAAFSIPLVLAVLGQTSTRRDGRTQVR